MSEEEDRDDDDRRVRGNLIGLVAVVLLVAVGLWLMHWLSNYEQTSDCVAAGHRNCVAVDQP